MQTLLMLVLFGVSGCWKVPLCCPLLAVERNHLGDGRRWKDRGMEKGSKGGSEEGRKGRYICTYSMYNDIALVTHGLNFKNTDCREETGNGRQSPVSQSSTAESTRDVSFLCVYFLFYFVVTAKILPWRNVTLSF